MANPGVRSPGGTGWAVFRIGSDSVTTYAATSSVPATAASASSTGRRDAVRALSSHTDTTASICGSISANRSWAPATAVSDTLTCTPSAPRSTNSRAPASRNAAPQSSTGTSGSRHSRYTTFSTAPDATRRRGVA